MEYHADRDSYICRNGRELTVTNERRSKTASGYVSVKTYYRSPDCTGCPYKTECIKAVSYTHLFFNAAVGVLQTLVVALGAGLGIWGAINLLEGYGNDNRATRS